MNDPNKTGKDGIYYNIKAADAKHPVTMILHDEVMYNITKY